MNNREIDERIKDIDAQLAELEKEETKEKEVVERVKPDQTEEAMETLKEVVGEFHAIEDLKAFRDNDEQLYKNMLLTVVSWFNYLKREKAESSEYEEAKSLVMSIGKKHTILYDWCKDFVEKPLTEYEPFINMADVELNVDESNEYEVNEDLKVVFDSEQVKEYISKTELSENLNSRVLDYKIIYKGTEYACHHYYVDYLPKWEFDEECPFRVSVINAKTDDNGNNIVVFNVLTWKLIKVEK